MGLGLHWRAAVPSACTVCFQFARARALKSGQKAWSFKIAIVKAYRCLIHSHSFMEQHMWFFLWVLTD